MTTTSKPVPTWTERLERLALKVRNFLREFAYGIDAWSAVTHGVEPSKPPADLRR